MLPPDSLLVLVLALAAEARFGYPKGLYARIGHPVTWIGRLITILEHALNAPSVTYARRRAGGVLGLALLLLATGLPALALEQVLLAADALGIVALALVASSALAQRSLHQHVAAVPDRLRRGGLDGGRAAVSMIVGRNPATLDEAGVCRAAIESLAENFSDGVVAPALWLGAGGLVGAALYKATNTADSMVGHRTAQYEAFGWAAARFDDLVNVPASRISALLLVGAAALRTDASARGAWDAVWNDARRHRSPNAGWPEAAMAGALSLKLAGPRIYGDVRVEDAWIGDGRAVATPHDVDRALALYRTACMLLFAIAAALAAVAVLNAR